MGLPKGVPNGLESLLGAPKDPQTTPKRCVLVRFWGFGEVLGGAAPQTPRLKRLVVQRLNGVIGHHSLWCLSTCAFEAHQAMVSDDVYKTLDNQELTNELGERSEPLRFSNVLRR